MGPLADQFAVRYAEAGEAYVGRLRTQHETCMQVSGPSTRATTGTPRI